MVMTTRTESLIRLWTVLLALICSPVLVAHAQQSTDSLKEIAQLEQQLMDGNTAQRINSLNRLAQLGNAEHAAWVFPMLQDEEQTVRRVAQAVIWQLWGRSGDKDTDMEYQQGLELMSAGDLPHAIDVFSHLVEQHPLFAEAWNKRATLYFMLGQFDLSILDCEQVLKLEPRHFGALSGYARMLISKGQFERALDYMERANQVNPHMPDAEQAIRNLRRQIWSRKENMVKHDLGLKPWPARRGSNPRPTA